MANIDKAMNLSDEDFKQIIGVKKETFIVMVGILEQAYNEKHKRRGRHAKLSREDQLFLTLKYLRQYVTQKELAFEFEVGEATVHDTIEWVEGTLVKSGKFRMPGKKALRDGQSDIEIVVVDVSESPIERPKKNSAAGTQAKKSGTPSKPS